MFAEPSGRGRNDSPRQTSGMVGNSAKGDDEMTDDKGVEEYVYKHSVYCHAMGDTGKCFMCAYERGAKAERERCLNVLKKYFDDGKEFGDFLEAIRLEIKGLI